MFVKVRIRLEAYKMMDMSKSASDVQSEMWSSAKKGLESEGYDLHAQEYVTTEYDILEASRAERAEKD